MTRIMYHISKEAKWKPGDKIISGKYENPFWVQCKNYLPHVIVDNQSMSLFRMFDTVTNFEVTQQNIDYLYINLKNVSIESALYIREQVFENIRQSLFPQLPSRQKCLWLTELDQIDYWKTKVIAENQFILSLEVDVDLFCGDDYWLTANTLSAIEYANRAVHYWSGEMSDVPIKEYLFNGTAIVKEVTTI